MLPYLVAACLSVGGVSPKFEIPGTYLLWSGYRIDRYDLKPNGKITITTIHDHPGKSSWLGTWSEEHGAVNVQVSFRRNDKQQISFWQWVPVRWGDRLMLIDSEDMLSGAIQRKFLRVGELIKERGSRFGWEKTDIFVAVRAVDARSPLPLIYGKPIAPPNFQELLPKKNVPRFH